MANQKEKSASKFIKSYHSVQNEAMSKLIEIGLSASKDEMEIQATILNELNQATNLSDKNESGRSLLNVVMNGIDSITSSKSSKLISSDKIIPECAFFKGLIDLKNGDDYAQYKKGEKNSVEQGTWTIVQKVWT